jgi:hypothetical protein
MDKLFPALAEQNEELEHEGYDVIRRKLQELQRYLDVNDPGSESNNKKTSRKRVA